MAYYAPFYQPTYYPQTPARQDIPQYNQQFQQPVQTAPQQIAPPMAQQTNNGLIWVQGEAGAKSYLVAPGNTVMLMDSEGDRFYIKSADASGMPMPLRVFDYKERGTATQQAASPSTTESVNFNNFVTRDEFERRMADMTAQCHCRSKAKHEKEASEINESAV